MNLVLRAGIGISKMEIDVLKIGISLADITLSLYGLETGLQKCFERHGAYKMFQELKLVFHTHARVERYETSDKYFAYKMEENSSTSEHVLILSGYYNCLNQVGVNLPDKIVIDRIL